MNHMQVRQNTFDYLLKLLGYSIVKKNFVHHYLSYACKNIQHAL